MKKLALRAIKLNRIIEEKNYKAIEVHPTSTRKALQTPPGVWKAMQESLITRAERRIRSTYVATHEIDADTAA